MKLNNKVGLLVVLSTALLLSPLGSVTAAGKKQTVAIQGWPHNSPKQFKLSSTDPIWDRLACPPLTRLNLIKQRGEPVLLRSIKSTGQSWVLELRSGLQWWDQSSVSAKDLKSYLEDHLSDILRAKSTGLWTAPSFSSKAVNNQLTLTWKKKPSFGPYVLNDVPFRRQAKDSLGYECAGPYKVKRDGQSRSLVAVRKTDKISEFTFPSNTSNSGSWFRFSFSDEFGANPWTRPSDRSAKCTRKIDMPLLSIIAWNTEHKLTSEASFRKILTQMTPRGELLRAGAAYLGDLLSGPILRAHPGYARRVLVRSFNNENAGIALSEAGYKRPNSNGPRLTPEGKPMVLRIHTLSGSLGLIKKVLSDSFASNGIKVVFSSGSRSFDKDSVHGLLTSISLPWPGLNLINDFHSRSQDTFPFWPLSSQSLDKALEDYARSLSQQRPNFKLLRRIHKQIYDLEPMTILMQHRACLQASSDVSKRLRKVLIRDPDWFYSISK